jgi:hypothetical protein
MTKTCSRCGETKPLESFHRNRSRHDGRAHYCKPCNLAWKRVDYQKHRPRRIASSRRQSLRVMYGLTPEDWERMLREQAGGCAICGAGVSDRRWARLHVDHCHVTGVVRGLLCSNCNIGLGMFDDDTERLRTAIQYLDKETISAAT